MEAISSSAFIPRLTCGMRWADAPSVVPTSELALTVTSAIEGIQVSSINMDRAASGDDEIVEVKTHACCLTRYHLFSIHLGVGRRRRHHQDRN